MREPIRAGLVLAALCALNCAGAWASGGSRVEEPAAATETPEQQADQRYNEGLASRDSAWRLQKKLAK